MVSTQKHILFYRFLLFFCFTVFAIVPAQVSRSDSAAIELKKIKERNNLLRIKDSIRTSVLNEQLKNIVAPKSGELEKYKNELLKIRQQDSLRLAAQKQAVNDLREKVKPYPVQLFHKTLFNIYSGMGPFSAKERALTAEQEIRRLYDRKVYLKDSLKTEPAQEFINIVYQGNIITSVAIEDALWENKPQDSLAMMYRDAINTQIEASRKSHTFENTALRWLLAIGIIIGFIALVFLIRRLFRFIIRKIILQKKKEKKGLKIKNYQFMNPRQLRMLLVRLLKWAHLIIFFLLTGVAISMIFSIFPATEHWAYMLLHWIGIPLKDLGNSFYHYIPNLIRIIVILVLGRYLDKLLRYLSLEIERGILKIKGFHPDWAKPTYHLIRICLIAFVIIMIFPYLPGSDTSAFRGISVFFGVLLSLGSSSAIANTIAGFIITYMRPFQIGDWIKVNDVTGEVIEKTALVTRLRTINNEDVTVPNSMILTNKTTNYSSSSPENGLIIPINIYVNFDVPFSKVNELLIAAALQTEGVLAEPKPYVFKNAINETNVLYQLNAFTLSPERMYFITSDLNENILKVFREAGIDLMSPRFFSNPHKK